MNAPVPTAASCQERIASIEFHLLRIVAASLRSDPWARLVHDQLRKETLERVDQAVALLREAPAPVRHFGVLIRWTGQQDHGRAHGVPSVDAVRAICALLYAAAMDLEQSGCVRATPGCGLACTRSSAGPDRPALQ